MAISADRASGLFFFLAGTIAYFFVIPAFVEPADSGSIHPDTLPNALCILIAVCGLVVVAKPTKHRLHSVRHIVMSGVYFALICLGLYAMTFFGYVVVSPFLALALMLLIGERRPFWLLMGAAVMPASIWLLVEVVLERGLP